MTCAAASGRKNGTEMEDAGCIRGGAVAVNEGKIAAVGSSAEIESEFESANVVDAAGMSVVPGFVECHTHIVFGGNRVEEFELKIKGADYLEILESGGGILSTVAATRAASADELKADSAKRLNRLLAGGVTTCEIKTGYGLDTETELKMLSVIQDLDAASPVDVIPTFLPAHAVPGEWKEREDEFTKLICDEMIPEAAGVLKRADGGIDGFIDVFCEKGAFDLDQCKKVILAAKEFGFAIKAHVDEFTNLGCARYAIGEGATSIDHLDATSEEEIALLAESETIGVVTPTVNFNFGSCDFADARKLIDTGCAIALSTDYNPGSAPTPSLQMAMAIACRYQKILPAEALNAVTLNAAAAVGRSNSCGSIEAGKNADLLILATDDYRDLCYEYGWNHVATVIKAGKILPV